MQEGRLSSVIFAAQRNDYKRVKAYMDSRDALNDEVHHLIDIAIRNENTILLDLLFQYPISLPADYRHPLEQFIRERTHELHIHNFFLHMTCYRGRIFTYFWKGINCCLRATTNLPTSRELLFRTLFLALRENGTIATIKFVLNTNIDVRGVLVSCCNNKKWPIRHEYVELLVEHGAVITTDVIAYRKYDKNFQKLVVKDFKRRNKEKVDVQLVIFYICTSTKIALPLEIKYMILQYALANKRLYFKAHDLLHFNTNRDVRLAIIEIKKFIKSCDSFENGFLNQMSIDERNLIRSLQQITNAKEHPANILKQLQHVVSAFISKNSKSRLANTFRMKYPFLVNVEKKSKPSEELRISYAKK